MNASDLLGLDPVFSAVIEETLPATAKNIARLIGLKRALDLISVYGGMDIRFTKKDGRLFGDLAQLIGEDATIRLADEYACHESVYIPICHKTKTAFRNRELAMEFDRLINETSVREAANILAQRYGMSNRQIEKVVNKNY